MVQYAASHLLIALKEEEYKISELGKSTILDIYDRFTVEIPYSNSVIKVRVMLNGLDTNYPPDLIILYPMLEVPLDYTQLFRDWNPTDKKALLIVFERVKLAFFNFYLEVFNILKNDNMNFIYRSCLNLLDGRQMEILLAYDDQEIIEVIFSLPVPVTLAHESCTRPVICNIQVTRDSDKFSVDVVYPN